MKDSSSPRLRRSLHFVPGGNEHMFNKALALPADALILDLEDAVSPDHKRAARDSVCEWLQADFGHRERLVRINAQDTAWGREDLEAIMAAKPDGIVLPKIASRAGVDAIDQIVSALEPEHGIETDSVSLILIGTETPQAVFNLPQMLRNSRVSACAWGVEDLSTTLGATASRDADGRFLEVFAYARSSCLLAAAAADIQAVDAVYADIRDLQGLAGECKTAASMGFAGKLTVHPDQIDVVNEAFTPAEEAVAQARALLAAFAEVDDQAQQAFAWEGRMVDAPHRKQAQAIVDLADRIAALNG